MSDQLSLFAEHESQLVPKEIRCISMWQPWASAVALGLKKIETRSWSTDYRGLLLIHAAKKWNGDLKKITKDLMRTIPGLPGDPPRGRALCIVNLVDCREMDLVWMKDQTEQEYSLGHWDHGRFGWVLENPRLFRAGEDMAMKGRQGFWSVSADEFLRKLACDCCDKADQYNGYGSDGPRAFICPKSCPCHD